MKKAVVITLTLLAACTSLLAAHALQNYAVFYLDDLEDGAMAGMVLFVFCLVMLDASVRRHHLWRHYLPFWVGLFLLDIFTPYNSHTTGILFYPMFGFMSLVLVIAVWLVKRYWTVRAR